MEALRVSNEMDSRRHSWWVRYLLVVLEGSMLRLINFSLGERRGNVSGDDVLVLRGSIHFAVLFLKSDNVVRFEPATADE